MGGLRPFINLYFADSAWILVFKSNPRIFRKTAELSECFPDFVFGQFVKAERRPTRKVHLTYFLGKSELFLHIHFSTNG